MLLPKIVYHYTSMEALVSIVNNRNLRATSVGYLNDHQEREIFLDAVRNRFSKTLNLPNSVEDEFQESLNPTNRSFLSQDEISPFVVSFSEEDDSLMHWRSYCPQQNGVSIGFETECLGEARVDLPPQPGMTAETALLNKVSYIGSSDDPLVVEHITLAYEAASRLKLKFDSLYPSSQRCLGEYFRESVEARACFFKHHSFKMESEYRVILGDVMSREDVVQFRSTRSTLVPFVPLWIPSKFDIHKGLQSKKQSISIWDAISSLTIGPTVNMHLSDMAVRALFKSKGMTHVEVRESRVPYRDW